MAVEQEDDVPLAEKMQTLTKTLGDLQKKPPTQTERFGTICVIWALMMIDSGLSPCLSKQRERLNRYKAVSKP